MCAQKTYVAILKVCLNIDWEINIGDQKDRNKYSFFFWSLLFAAALSFFVFSGADSERSDANDILGSRCECDFNSHGPLRFSFCLSKWNRGLHIELFFDRCIQLY